MTKDFSNKMSALALDLQIRGTLAWWTLHIIIGADNVCIKNWGRKVYLPFVPLYLRDETM